MSRPSQGEIHYPGWNNVVALLVPQWYTLIAMFLVRQRQKTKTGRVAYYWTLRATIWDKDEKRSKQVYLAYVGPTRTITESKAREIACKVSGKLGKPVTIENLRKVKRLRIVPD